MVVLCVGLRVLLLLVIFFKNLKIKLLKYLDRNFFFAQKGNLHYLINYLSKNRYSNHYL